MLFNNIDDGYLEGLLRGLRGGILTSADYANLCQCESIDGAPRTSVLCVAGGAPCPCSRATLVWPLRQASEDAHSVRLTRPTQT